MVKMIRLKPVITESLNKLNKLTSLPVQSDIAAKEKDTKNLVHTLARSTDGSIKEEMKA